MKNYDKRNKYFFGLGTIGRDMFYAFEANTIIYFLTNVLSLPMWVFAITSTLLSVLRIVDAINDPITGLVIDNIRSPWGKFKPAILIGGIHLFPDAVWQHRHRMGVRYRLCFGVYPVGYLLRH